MPIKDTIPVDVELEELEPPDVLYHGTAEKYVASIEAAGLQHQSRLFVHLTDNYGTAIDVGRRHGKPVVYEIASQAMFKEGCKFFLSVNGVWLTESVPVKYLKRL